MLATGLVALAAAASLVDAQLTPNVSPLQAQFSQDFYDGYNPLKHWGGNGPYVNGDSYGLDRNPPEQCTVDQVIMLHRHGERYPDPSVAEPMIASYNKIIRSNVTEFKGSLSFINKWEPFLTDPALFAQESFMGPYNGLLNGYHRGALYRNRYGHLWDGQSTVPIFSSGYERIINTARKFGEGFFGYNYSTIAELNIIPETPDQGANSLTPSCYVPGNEPAALANVTKALPQFAAAAARFNAENPGLNLNSSDVANLMLLAPFELNSRQVSPWVDAFTYDEWVAFGYYQDLNYYYGAGPGLNTSAPIGAVYANASLTLLNQGPEEALPMYWNFCHDTNITPVLAALGLFVPENPLPLDSVKFNTIYKSGNFVPMGGHLVLERLNCNATSTHAAGIYVRTVVNEAVIVRDNCNSGPGFSCPLAQYTTDLQAILPEFKTVCEVPAEFPQDLSFWWNYNHTNTLNYQQGPIPFQMGLATWDDQPVPSS